MYFSPYRAVKTYTALVTQTSQLLLYREIIAVCSQIHTKHINTLFGQNVQLLNVKLTVCIVTTGLEAGIMNKIASSCSCPYGAV